MKIAIDTSTEIASIAIVQDDKVLAELTWYCGQNHSVELLPRLTYLLEKSGLEIESADGIIVAKGPGSFNGLRVGITTAKGLAFTLRIPLIGISTLEAAAYQHAETGLPVCPVFNAGRGEIATAMYQYKRGKWRQLTEEHISTVEKLCSEINSKTVFCGDFLPSVAQEIIRYMKQKAVFPPGAALLRRAGFLAELGQQRLSAGEHDDPATLQPIYLRRPAITKPKKNIPLVQESLAGRSEASTSIVKAVIWDMDGVIVDTGPYHFKAWQYVFQKNGAKFTEEDFRQRFGQRNDTIIKAVLGQDTPHSKIEAIASEKEANYRERVRGNIKPLPGAIELLKSLKENGFKVALGSSAPAENVNLIIENLDIGQYFQAIVSGREVKEGKPSPQGFLLAAERLGVKPENCIVIEDAVAGVAAAKRAGMKCIAVTNTHPGEKLSEADLVVDSLESVTISDLERLLKR